MLFTGVKYFILANQSATAMLNNLAAILFINIIIIIIKPINLIRQFETWWSRLRNVIL